MTRDRARKRAVRARMAASAEPYSVAARKIGRAGAPGEATGDGEAARDGKAARDEVITRVEATLAAASARIEVRKLVTAGPAIAPNPNPDPDPDPDPNLDQDPTLAPTPHRRGPLRRLAGAAVRGGWDHVVPEQTRTRLRTAFSGSYLGVIEPSAGRFQYVAFKRQRSNALAQLALGLDEGPAAGVYPIPGEDPLALLLRLRPATAASYAGEETVREARCRKIAVTVGGTPAVLTVWVDDEHVRQIRAVTSRAVTSKAVTSKAVTPQAAAAGKAKRIAVAMAATTTVTAQLWDFGAPPDQPPPDQPPPDQPPDGSTG